MMAATMRIWDPFVRVFHWSLVASFAVAWISAEEVKALHIWAGYAAGALIALRLVWGLVGTRYARFSQFVRSPLVVAAYLRDVVTGREARYLGHNPVGGLMIVALILAMAVVCATGWMQTTDAYWGAEWVEGVHEAMASLMLGLVGLHVLGVLVTGLRHRENLVRAMITGRKRSPGAADIA
jgi:cytochrome b